MRCARLSGRTGAVTLSRLGQGTVFNFMARQRIWSRLGSTRPSILTKILTGGEKHRVSARFLGFYNQTIATAAQNAAPSARQITRLRTKVAGATSSSGGIFSCLKG